MNIYLQEKKLFARGFDFVAGVDEAGRGPLAGPVVAACVAVDKVFKLKSKHKTIRDSKKLSEKKREELYDLILSEFSVGVGISTHKEIDEKNILQATFLAMQRAVREIKIAPEFLMIDGKFIIPKFNFKQEAFIKGDARVFLISAASIIAKVTRDRIMQEMHEQYPEYDFLAHKGYGTKKHLEKIKEFGPCPIHRKSFAPIKNMIGI